MNLLMISGDVAVARGDSGPFHHTLKLFSEYWGRIDVITPPAKDASPRQIHENVYIHPSPWPKALQPLFILRRGRKLFAERRYDLVVTHDFGLLYNGLGAWLLMGGSDMPLVSEIHHIEGHPFALTRRELLYRGLMRWYIQRAKARVAAFRVVNRNEMPQYLAELGVPESKILVLPSLYIDFSVFKPAPSAQKAYEVLFVGRLVSNKGVFTILEAVELLKEKHPLIRLCIAGDGPLRQKIQAHIHEHDLGENVTLIQRIGTPQDVAALYNSAKMLVCASTSEGGPRVTVEAMACGVPVVSTPVGVMIDLLESGKNFMAFNWHAQPLAETIDLLLHNAVLRKQLGENGEIAVQGFRAETIIDGYARAYQDLARAHTVAKP